MKKIILQPNQLIVPGEGGVSNYDILNIYFRVFSNGQGKILPPTIAVHKEIANIVFLPEEYKDEELWQRRNYENFNRILNSNYGVGAEYFLLDGNHRTIAATLTNNPIIALEMQEDEDIQKVKTMVEKGELFNWTISGDSLKKICNNLKEHLYEYFINNVEGFYCKEIYNFPLTVKDRIDKLVTNKEIPDYMINKYLGQMLE